MRILLNTHAFLWFIEGNLRLSPHARSLIEDTRNVRLLSYASLCETAIKASIGKLPLHEPFETLFPCEIHRNGIELVDFTIEHQNRVVVLQFHHRDSFDRILVAQSMIEGTPILSADPVFDMYDAQRLW